MYIDPASGYHRQILPVSEAMDISAWPVCLDYLSGAYDPMEVYRAV